VAARVTAPDWTAITAAIRAMVADVMPLVTGDPNEATDEDDLPIYWSRDDAGLPVGRDYWVELSLRSTRDLGMAEVRKSDHPTPTPGAERQVIVTVLSTFVLSIKVPSNRQSPDAAQNSRSILSAIRLALGAPEYVASFAAAGFAFSRVVRELGEFEDKRSGRDRAYAVLDVQFNAASAFEARPGTIIETVRVTGELDGASHPAQEFA
jgi:hypothetical protein